MIAYLAIQRFYVRALGLEEHPDPVVVTKDKRVLDLNHAALMRRVDAEMSARDAKACLMGGTFLAWEAASFIEAQKNWLDVCCEFSDIVEPDFQHSAWVDLHGHPDPFATFLQLRDRLEHAQGAITQVKWLSKLATYRGDPDFASSRDPFGYLTSVPIQTLELLEPEVRSRLEFLGYVTIGQASAIPLSVLRKQFGDRAVEISNILQGKQSQKVQAIYPERFVGERFYFPEPIDDIHVLDAAILKVAGRLGERLQADDLFGARLRLTVEFEGAPMVALERLFTKPLHDRRSIFFAVKRMVSTLPLDQPIKGFRVALPELERRIRHQHSFDSLMIKEKVDRAETALKCVRKSFGDLSIVTGDQVKIPRRQRVLKEWRDATGWQ